MASVFHRTIESVWRSESPRLIAGLARIVRDVGVAEELAQDALVAAMEQWPRDGMPENPGAWLMATARHRAIDQVRRKKRLSENTRKSAASARPQSRKKRRHSARSRTPKATRSIPVMVINGYVSIVRHHFLFATS